MMMNVTNRERTAIQKFFHLYGTFKPIIITDENFYKEFYPTLGLIFLLFICTYLTYQLAMRDSYNNQLILKYQEKLDSKNALIEQLQVKISSLEDINSTLSINHDDTNHSPSISNIRNRNAKRNVIHEYMDMNNNCVRVKEIKTMDERLLDRGLEDGMDKDILDDFMIIE